MHLAARFAAKEAVFKALGTGWSFGVAWIEAEVLENEAGQPSIRLSGRAGEIARRMGADRIHLSMTHTAGMAGAFVVLEASGTPDGSCGAPEERID